MRSSTKAAAAIIGVAAFLPSHVLAAVLRFPDVCSPTAVLEYFTCQAVAEDSECYDGLIKQANDWCIDYLSVEPVTTYATTVYDVAVETVAETVTVPAVTITDVATTSDLTSITTTAVTNTAWVTETTTSTRTFGVAPALPTMKKRIVASAVPALPALPAVSAGPSCVDLTKKNLLRHPASKLSSACGCLSVEPSTVTLSATTVAAETVTVTEPATATAGETTATALTTIFTSQLVAATTTVTSTTTTTATASVGVGLCASGYASGSYSGLSSRNAAFAGPTSALECCDACLKKPSCLRSQFYLGTCFHVTQINNSRSVPGSTSDQCPYGLEAMAFSSPATNGPYFKGPCAV